MSQFLDSTHAAHAVTRAHYWRCCDYGAARARGRRALDAWRDHLGRDVRHSHPGPARG